MCVSLQEKGTAPETIMHKISTNVTRPLCLHPLVAKYKGSGSTGDPTNFECAANPVGPDTEGATAAKATAAATAAAACHICDWI